MALRCINLFRVSSTLLRNVTKPNVTLASRFLSVTPRKFSEEPTSVIYKKNNLSPEEKKEIEDKVKIVTKDWVSHGYSTTDRDEDEGQWNIVMFFSVTVFLCGGAFILLYKPDPNMHEWIQREAYLELNRRERLGLPLIDPNLVPLERITLPSEEELGENFKIII